MENKPKKAAKKVNENIDFIAPTDQELLMIDALFEVSNSLEIDESEVYRLYQEFFTTQDTEKEGFDDYSSSSIDDNYIESILKLGTVIKSYELSKKPMLPLPEALESAVSRYFAAEMNSQEKTVKTVAKKSVGSLILKLGTGLELISSALSDLEPVFVTVAQTRRSGEDQQRLSMKEPIKGGGLIEYSILRSTEDTVMVTLLFQELLQPLTVKLSENGRPISSQTVSDQSGRIHFDGLYTGEYRIDMSGSIERSFTLHLIGATA